MISVQTLTSHLSLMLGDGVTAPEIVVIERVPNPYCSTYGSEILTCLVDGREAKFFCKFGQSVSPESTERGGLGYEAEVYRAILNPLLSGAPSCVGCIVDSDTSSEYLVLEYLQEGRRLKQSQDQCPPELAASWLGRFHAVCSTRIQQEGTAFLYRYSREHYMRWIGGAIKLAAGIGDRQPNLSRVCQAFAELLPGLLDAPLTVIHGEFFPSNIMLRSRDVCPVDWETAAIGAGEIDLAALIEGWSSAIADRCVAAYVRERWRGKSPQYFDSTLTMARLYWYLNWLGRLSSTDEYDINNICETVDSLGADLGIH